MRIEQGGTQSGGGYGSLGEVGQDEIASNEEWRGRAFHPALKEAWAEFGNGQVGTAQLLGPFAVVDVQESMPARAGAPFLRSHDGALLYVLSDGTVGSGDGRRLALSPSELVRIASRDPDALDCLLRGEALGRDDGISGMPMAAIPHVRGQELRAGA